MLVNCKTCGRLFSGMGQFGLCQDCGLQEREQLQKINEYLMIRPDAEIQDIAHRTGVPLAVIVRLMRDGKFTTKNTPSKCSRCNKPSESLKKGMCDPCMAQLSGSLKTEIKTSFSSNQQPWQKAKGYY